MTAHTLPTKAALLRPVAPSVSIIIPHYNDVERLNACLDAIAHCDAYGIRYDTTVVDNGSSIPLDELRSIVGERATLLFCSERGAGPARNAGVAATTGEVLAFVDSDCIVTDGWLRAGRRALARADVVGGQVSLFGADPERLSGAEAYEIVFGFDFKSYIEKKGFVGSGNMFVRRADFDRVGPFLKVLSEDIDWSRRARALGLKIAYSHAAEVRHPARATWAELLVKFRRLHGELYALGKTRPLGRLQWTLRSLAMPTSILAHAPRLLFSKNCRTWHRAGAD